MRRFLLLSLTWLSLTHLGFGRDITTLSGQTFQDAVVTGVQRTGLDIRFSGGTAFLNFADLPGDEVAKFFQSGNSDLAAAPQWAPTVAGPGPQGPALDSVEDDAADSWAPGPSLEVVPEIVALDGSVYNDVVITSVGRTGFRFHHRNGSGFLDFAQLPDHLRHRYGFNENSYANGVTAREQRAQQFSAATQQRISTAAATRPQDAQRERAVVQSALTQQAVLVPNRGAAFNSGTQQVFRGVPSRGVSGGSFSGRGTFQGSGGSVHSSGGHR